MTHVFQCKYQYIFYFFFSDLSTYTWSELPCKGTPPSPRYFHSCCIHGNKLYTYGGYSGSERLADMFAYGESSNLQYQNCIIMCTVEAISCVVEVS